MVRWLRGMVIGTVAVLGCAAMGGAGDGISGSIVVIDGDSLEIGGSVYHLYGIDAPELGQTCKHDERTWHCGIDAAYALHKIVGMSGHSIVCRPEDAHLGGETVARCSERGRSLSAMLVESGHAVVVVDDALLREDEVTAKDGRIGLWDSDFTVPAEWRERAGKDRVSPCPVKAVRRGGTGGTYHVPLDDDYEEQQISNSRGDRLFCSDDAARAAGFRRPAESQ